MDNSFKRRSNCDSNAAIRATIVAVSGFFGSTVVFINVGNIASGNNWPMSGRGVLFLVHS